MSYEARHNVTADAAALCVMAGNAVVLRGGSEAIHSNTAIAAALRSALVANGVPAAALTLVEDLRRETMVELLQLTDIVDLAIPRGGEGLIRFVAEHARVPVIKHYKRSEEHTSELQSLMRISYAVFCLKKKNTSRQHTSNNI